jgi:hypothetical protein
MATKPTSLLKLSQTRHGTYIRSKFKLLSARGEEMDIKKRLLNGNVILWTINVMALSLILWTSNFSYSFPPRIFPTQRYSPSGPLTASFSDAIIK